MWGLTARPYLCGMGGWVTGPGPRVLCGHPEGSVSVWGLCVGGGREYVGTDCAALICVAWAGGLQGLVHESFADILKGL